MYSKAEKNYFIDIVLVIIGFACMITGVTLALKPAFLMPILMAMNLKSFHEWTGYVLIVLIGWHLIMHSGWIKSITKAIVKDKKKLITGVLTVVVSISICITIVSLSSAMKAPNGKTDNPGRQVEKR